MGLDIEVKLDTKQFTERLDFAAKEAINAMRRTIDRTARAARKDAIKTMSRDIGVPASKFRDATPLVKGSTQNSLSAVWTIKKKAIGALNAGTFAPGMSYNRGSYSGSTFRLTGGGSASLNIPKAFVIESNGGRALMVRTGPGRKDFKPVYLEMPSTGMAQEKAAPRVDWTKAVDRLLGSTMATEIQLALDGVAGQNPSAIGGE